MKKDFNTSFSGKEERNSFITPDNYFEELPEKIISRYNKNTQSANIRYIFQKPILAYAASIVIIISVSLSVLFYSDYYKKNSSTDYLNSTDENLLYIADLHGIDESSVVDFMAENDYTSNEAQFNEDDVIDYIDTNTNNTNEILELIE